MCSSYTQRDACSAFSLKPWKNFDKIIRLEEQYVQGGPKKVRKTFVLYSVSFKIYSMKFGLYM